MAAKPLSQEEALAAALLAAGDEPERHHLTEAWFGSYADNSGASDCWYRLVFSHEITNHDQGLRSESTGQRMRLIIAEWVKTFHSPPP